MLEWKRVIRQDLCYISHMEKVSSDNYERYTHPLVSIITPTFNRGYILGRTIESVIDQTYPAWEHIIVDDGSSDNTSQIVAQFNEARIKYVTQENSGPSSARNRALSLAQGDWIAYIDSDNELFPTYLEVMLESICRLKSAEFAIACGKRTQELYEDGEMIDIIDDSSDFPASLTAKDIGLRTHHFDINGFMHSRKVIETGIRFDEVMKSLEDWDFAIQVADKFPNGLVYVIEPLFHYHQRYGTDGLVSNATYGDWAKSFERIYQKHKGKKLLIGQTWYPDRVDKYTKLQSEYELGKIPPQYLMLFTRKH